MEEGFNGGKGIIWLLEIKWDGKVKCEYVRVLGYAFEE